MNTETNKAISNQPPYESDSLLTSQEAADYFKHSRRTLEKWRLQGIGPTFIKTGRLVRYRFRDIQAWIEANTTVTGGV